MRLRPLRLVRDRPLPVLIRSTDERRIGVVEKAGNRLVNLVVR